MKKGDGLGTQGEGGRRTRRANKTKKTRKKGGMMARLQLVQQSLKKGIHVYTLEPHWGEDEGGNWEKQEQPKGYAWTMPEGKQPRH